MKSESPVVEDDSAAPGDKINDKEEKGKTEKGLKKIGQVDVVWAFDALIKYFWVNVELYCA